MLENVLKSLKDHYVLDDNKFKTKKDFNQQLAIFEKAKIQKIKF